MMLCEKYFTLIDLNSVKELMLFCRPNEFDFRHAIYDLVRVKFLNGIYVRFHYVTVLYKRLELQFRAVSHIEIKYSCSVDGNSSSCLRLKLAAHFASLVLS
jgi:hypothetical protein